MDVNDLKSLNAEVKKRMTGAIEHLRHELAGVRTGRASTGILDPVHVDAYGTSMPINQVASLSVPEPTHDRRPAVRPLADGRHREGDPRLGPRPEPEQRRQGRPHPRAGADRRAPQGAVAPRPQDGRGSAQRRPRRPARRQRPAEEAGRRTRRCRRTTRSAASTRSRRSPTSTSSRSTSCRRRRTGNCSRGNGPGNQESGFRNQVS